MQKNKGIKRVWGHKTKRNKRKEAENEDSLYGRNKYA